MHTTALRVLPRPGRYALVMPVPSTSVEPDPGTIAYVALGSNLGDRRAHLRFARAALADLPETRERAVSRIYETAPVGPPGQGTYLNAVIALETDLSPRVLLHHCLRIEGRAGRQRRREQRWGARTLDLDLLLQGRWRCTMPDLELPHPRLHQRAFVLVPLCELAPDLVHPILETRIDALRDRRADAEPPGRRPGETVRAEDW